MQNEYLKKDWVLRPCSCSHPCLTKVPIHACGNVQLKTMPMCTQKLGNMHVTMCNMTIILAGCLSFGLFWPPLFVSLVMIPTIDLLFNYLYCFNLYQGHKWMCRALNTPQLNFVGRVHDLHEQHLFCFRKTEKKKLCMFYILTKFELTSFQDKCQKKATSNKGSPTKQRKPLNLFSTKHCIDINQKNLQQNHADPLNRMSH
jgi:hypothetical protein